MFQSQLLRLHPAQLLQPFLLVVQQVQVWVEWLQSKMLDLRSPWLHMSQWLLVLLAVQDIHQLQESMRARTEEHKKPRINPVEQRAAEQQEWWEQCSLAKKSAAECQNESVEENTDDAWCGEDELYFAGTPEVVWSDWDLKGQPPDSSVDQVAD